MLHYKDRKKHWNKIWWPVQKKPRFLGCFNLKWSIGNSNFQIDHDPPCSFHSLSIYTKETKMGKISKVLFGSLFVSSATAEVFEVTGCNDETLDVSSNRCFSCWNLASMVHGVDVVMPWTYFPPFQNVGRQGATRESISHEVLLTEYCIRFMHL